MDTIPVWLNIDEAGLVVALQDAGEKLDAIENDAVLDFSSVQRIDPSGLRAMQEFVRIADEKSVRVILRGVNPDVFKVLKLVRLAKHFSFVN